MPRRRGRFITQFYRKANWSNYNPRTHLELARYPGGEALSKSAQLQLARLLFFILFARKT
jgi:hypothetical protein